VRRRVEVGLELVVSRPAERHAEVDGGEFVNHCLDADRSRDRLEPHGSMVADVPMKAASSVVQLLDLGHVGGVSRSKCSVKITSGWVASIAVTSVRYEG